MYKSFILVKYRDDFKKRTEGKLMELSIKLAGYWVGPR